MGVGDVEKIINYENTGVIIKKFDQISLRKAAEDIIILSNQPDIAQRCRRTALKFFSLEDGIKI